MKLVPKLVFTVESLEWSENKMSERHVASMTVRPWCRRLDCAKIAELIEVPFGRQIRVWAKKPCRNFPERCRLTF